MSRMTGYTVSKEECGNDKGITWSGRKGVLAISGAFDDTYWAKHIMRGDWVYVEDFGPVRMDDTGVKAPWGVQGRNRIDLLVATKKLAYEINRRPYRRVWYIGPVSNF